MSDIVNINNVMPMDNMEDSWLPVEDSITQRVCAFANESLRRAANAIFGATARINNEISIVELLEALEDVGINSNNKINSNNSSGIKISETTPGVPIPSGSTESDVESMSTTCSSVDSLIFPQVASSPEIPEDEEEDDFIECGTSKKLRIISMDEVGEHYTPDDGWMILYDKVYNFTNFLDQHPGGLDVMAEYLGYDGTQSFRGVGHSKMALKMMDPYLIGILPKSERLYGNRGRW